MLLCNCQGSLCIGLKAEQRRLAIVWGRQHTLAAGRRFKLIVRRWLLELVKCSRKKIFIRGAFKLIFLRRPLAFDLSLFCLSFFDHVIALIQASDVSIRSRKSASDEAPPALVARPIFLASDRCPLLGVKQTWRLHREMSAYDPKRTSIRFLNLFIKWGNDDVRLWLRRLMRVGGRL